MNASSPRVTRIRKKEAADNAVASSHLPLSKYQIGPIRNASRLNVGTHLSPNTCQVTCAVKRSVCT